MTKKTSSADRVASLRKIPLFATLPVRSLQRLATLATQFESPAGTVLIQPKMQGAGLVVIEEGSVTIELPSRKLDLGPGEFFGELSLLTDKGHNARVRAKTSVRCLALSRADFQQMLQTEPKMALAMLEILAERLSSTR
ncbi:MAG: cyclic nucleotide-binding domain-containing protein [Actinomycetota bacterium]